MTSVVVTQTTINASVTQQSTSVSVTSTPINVTISPVDINSHSALTLGTANGLSLVGQVLSLALSSAGSTGALSSADWTTFNGKQSALGFTPVNIASSEWVDLTDGGATILHSHAGGGAVWGSITGTLSDQTDLQTALNAKQNSLTFPLASTLGGTGINNAGTLTNASNTTITGGGTVALGGFTLAVPATGTAALLATANVFTAIQKINVNSTTALLVEQDGVKDNVLIVNTTTGQVGVNGVADAGVDFQVNYATGGADASFKVKGAEHAFMTLERGITQRIATVLFRSGGTNIATFGLGSNSTDLSIDNEVGGKIKVSANSTTTNAVAEIMRIDASVSTGATGGAAGFGVGQSFYAETATDGTNQQQGLISTSWIDSTNASRKADLKLYAYDTAARLGLTIEASGSATKLAFYGGTTVVRGAALTTQLTTITHTSPGTPDYAVQDLVNITPYGFATQDEGNTVLSVIRNLQIRVAELEARLGSATGINAFA